MSANMEGEVKGRGLDGTCGSALKSNCEKMHPVAKPLKRSAAVAAQTLVKVPGDYNKREPEMD